MSANLRYRRDYLNKVVRRFENAVENLAFKGTIPCDSQAAINARNAIDEEYASSRKALLNLLYKMNGFDARLNGLD